MPEGQVLEFSGVTKRFGAVTAVSDFSARVEPGVVTGFLGPNGAGKTTSLRILLGLVHATAGTATIGGVPYAKLAHPLQSVGAVLEASSFHPGRTAANHLRVYAQAAGLPAVRVDEALGTVGLAEVAGRKVGGFSLGMRQRLGLAYALLGDPGVLVLDEPANGLDPEGIKWMRGLLRELARQGRTVLVSSHLLAEVQQTVDALLIISQGRLVFQGSLDELTDPSEYATVVDAPDRAALTQALQDAGLDFEVLRSGLTVRGVDTVAVGAAAAGVALSTLQRRGPGLEEVFLDLVNGTRVHASAADAAALPAEEAEGAPADADGAPTDAEGALAIGLAAGTAAAAADEAAPAGADGEAPPEAIAHEHAAFAVAGTGVIEVIPDEDAAAPAEGEAAPEEEAAPEPEQEGEPEPEVASEPEPEPEPEPSQESVSEPAEPEHVWAMPAAESHDTPADPDSQPEPADSEPTAEPDSEPMPEPEHDEEPPTPEPRTESDEEADRFFSAFDGPHEPGQDESAAVQEHDGAEPAPTDEPPTDQPPTDEPPTDESPTDEHEGGEQR